MNLILFLSMASQGAAGALLLAGLMMNAGVLPVNDPAETESPTNSA